MCDETRDALTELVEICWKFYYPDEEIGTITVIE